MLTEGEETRLFVLSTLDSNAGSREHDMNHNYSFGDLQDVLALEVLESGSAGKFYIICNLARHNDWEELSDEEIYESMASPGFSNFAEQIHRLLWLGWSAEALLF